MTDDTTTDNENRYLKNDLEDYAETPEDSVDNYGRKPHIEALLPDSAVIELYSTGGYQGTQGYVIVLDGYYWLIKEFYGSCGGCDGFLAATDRIEYARSMLRNAYCFDDPIEAKTFLAEQAEGSAYGWAAIASEMQDMINDVSNNE